MKKSQPNFEKCRLSVQDKKQIMLNSDRKVTTTKKNGAKIKKKKKKCYIATAL